MISISGSITIAFNEEELKMLYDMATAAVWDSIAEGDEPSEGAWNILRKVTMLMGIDDASCHTPLPRGGVVFDPRAMDIETPGWDRVENKQPLGVDSEMDQEWYVAEAR